MKIVKSLLFATAAFAGIAAFSGQADAAEVKHVVTPEDTLTGISLKYYGDTQHIDAIAKANGIKDVNLIYDGDTLVFDTDDQAVAAQPAVEEAAAVAEPAAAEPVVEETAPAAATTATAEVSGQTLYMESTAYSSDPADVTGGGIYTATGQNLLENPMAVAVDPSVIPLGTRLYVEGYGEAYAVDTGGAIQGNIIDVHFATNAQCEAWGRRQVKVTILG